MFPYTKYSTDWYNKVRLKIMIRKRQLIFLWQTCQWNKLPTEFPSFRLPNAISVYQQKNRTLNYKSSPPTQISGNKWFKSAIFPYITLTLINDQNDTKDWDSCQLLASSLRSVSQHRFNKQFKTCWSLKARIEAKTLGILKPFLQQ